MIRSILALLLCHWILALKLKQHTCQVGISDVRTHYSHLVDAKGAPVCEWLQKDLNEEKELTLNLATIYSMGKMPGQCNPQGISKEERQTFLNNADEVKSKILSTKAGLLDSDDPQRREAAQQLDEFQTGFLNCLKSIQGYNPSIAQSNKVSIPAFVPIPIPLADQTEQLKKLEQQRIQSEKQLKQRQAQIQKDRQKLQDIQTQSRLQQQRIVKEKAEQERIAKEKAEQERLERQRLEKERIAKEKAEKQRIERERIEQERLEKERLEKQRIEKERLEQERLEKQRLEKQRLEKQRIEKQRIQQQRLAKQKAEQQRLAKEAEQQRLAKQQAEKQRIAEEKAAQQQAEQQRLAQEQQKQRIAKQKAEKQKQAVLLKLKKEQEQKQQREREQQLRQQQEKQRKINQEKERKILQQKRLKQQRQQEYKQKQEEARQKQEQAKRAEEQKIQEAKIQAQNIKAQERLRLIQIQKQKQEQAESEKVSSNPNIVAPIPVPIVPLSTEKSLLPKQFVTNPLARNIIIDNRADILERYLKNLNDNTKDYDACPINTPYYDGDQCITCKEYFNMNTRECTSCPKDTKYDELTLKCVKSIYVTNLNADNLWFKERNIDEWKTFEDRVRSTSPSTIVQCPLETPFATNSQCIKCPSDSPLFDIITSTCLNCPEGQSYNSNQRKCLDENTPSASAVTVTPLVAPVQATTQTKTQVKTEGKTKTNYLTNPSTNGLIIDTETLEQFTNQYKSLKQDKDKTYEDCPVERPYFNGKQCISCTGENNLFKVSTKTCSKCEEGYAYVYQFKSCLALNKE